MHPTISAISGGLLAFGAVFVEMFFILSSIWQVRPLLFLEYIGDWGTSVTVSATGKPLSLYR